MIMIVFPLAERGKALGIMVAIATSFLALGPLVGGLFTEAVSWRWIFWINVPIVLLAALVILLAWSDPPRKASETRFDWGGLALLTGGLGLLVFGLMQGADWGWGNPAVLAGLFGGLLLLAVFHRFESRQADPLIAVSLFRGAAFSACNAMLLAGQFSKMTIVVFGALYLQRELAMSPLAAGLALLPAVAAFPLLSAKVGHLADRLPIRRLVLSGLSLASAAMLWIGLAAPWHNYPLLLPGLLLWGGGLVLCYAPTLRAMANSVPQEMQGQCSGIGINARLIGGVLGVAICSGLLVGTADFQLVFLITAAVMLAALLFGWLALEREGGG